MSQPRPAAVVAADPCFPASLAAPALGACIAMVRVEDGSLAEIRNTLRDLLRAYTPPSGSLPSGSVILTGSISHLARVGVARYAEDLARHIAALETDFGSAVSVVPYVLVMPAAVHTPALIADLFDLDC